jgi:hypothetical protein
MPDTKLKDAAKEIQAILEKYDIAGIIHLSSPTHLEYLYFLSPTWSCASMEETEDGVGIRFKSKLADFPSVEDQKKCAEATIGTFFGFHHLSKEAEERMFHLIKMIGGHYDISNYLKEE